MTTIIDVPEALAMIDKAVSVKGEDHVQEVCEYVTEIGTNPQPGCIIGTGLWETIGSDLLIEVASGTWQDLDNGHRLPLNEALLETLRDALRTRDVQITDSAAKVMQAAQDVQDGRVTADCSWGAAREAAKEATYW